MKKILLLLVALLCLSSCNRVEPIHKLSQLEPGLRKHVGDPTEITTNYRKTSFSNGSLAFFYDDAPEGTFEKLVSFLSDAYGYEPDWEFSTRSKTAKFIPQLKEEGIYVMQASEWIVGKEKKKNIIFTILDVFGELVPPPTSVSDSIPSTN